MRWGTSNLEGKGSRQHDLDAVLPMISDSSLTVVNESVVNSQSSLGVSNSVTGGEKVTRLTSCSFMVAIFSVKKFAKLLARSLADVHDG